MKTDFKKRLENYIRASFPCLSVETKEETRLLAMLKDIATERKRSCKVWSLTRGVVDLINGHSDSSLKDPLEFIHAIESSKDEKSINVILDPKPFLQDPVFCRTIKDAIPSFKEGRCLILTGCDFDIPKDLNHLVTKLSTPLPDREELDKVLTDVTKSNQVTVENGDRETTIEAMTGLTTDEAADAVALSIVETKAVDPHVVMREKTSNIGRRDYLRVETAIPNLEDVGGLDVLKNWLVERKAAFGKKARDFKLPTPKGLLMIGVPGCGKSLCAKTTASILEIPLVRFDIGAVMASLVGESEKNMRDALSIAEAMAPCVLWIDELDKQLSPSGGSSDGAHEVTKRVMSSILHWLQEKTAPVFVVATANNIQSLSTSFPEMLRKGRFNETFFVDLPNLTEREKIFRIHIKKTGRKIKDSDVKGFSKITEGFSGAEIEAVVQDAMYLAFNKGSDLSQEEILEAIVATIPQSKLAKSTIDALRDWAKGRARHATEEETKTDGKRSIDKD